MKLFIDSADVEVIRSAFETGLIDGVTTNPTLIRKSGRNPEDVYQELIEMGVTDVSMEVVGDDEIMLAEGRRLANKFGKNATIKVPCSPEGLWVCKQLTPSIKVNVTLYSHHHRPFYLQKQVQHTFHRLLEELMIIHSVVYVLSRT